MWGVWAFPIFNLHSVSANINLCKQRVLMPSFHDMSRETERGLSVAIDRHVETPLVIYPYSLAYKQFKFQVTLFTLKIVIYPYTIYDDIMGLIRPPLSTFLTMQTKLSARSSW